MDNPASSKYPGVITMDASVFQKLRKDFNVVHMFNVVQAVIIFLTLAVGFFALLYSLFDSRRRKPVWSLWCSLLCGFIQVCFCAATVFAAKHRHISPDETSIQCSDVYSIPMICDIVTLAVIVVSAFGAHVKNSKAVILKPVLFLYILISSVSVIVLQSWTKNYNSQSLKLTTYIDLQPTPCRSDPDEVLMVAVCEYVLIFLPIAVIFLFVYSRHRKTKDQKEMQFFVRCTDDGMCATCQHQNTVCKTVLIGFFVCLYVFRPVIVVLCSVYNIVYQDLCPSLISTAIYVYLCFEYCVILERNCKQSKETQTDGPSDTKISKDNLMFVEA